MQPSKVGEGHHSSPCRQPPPFSLHRGQLGGNNRLSPVTSLDPSFFIHKMGDGPLHSGTLWSGEWKARRLDYTPKAIIRHTQSSLLTRGDPGKTHEGTSGSSSAFWRFTQGPVHTVNTVLPLNSLPPAFVRHHQGGDGLGHSQILGLRPPQPLLGPPLRSRHLVWGPWRVSRLSWLQCLH